MVQAFEQSGSIGLVSSYWLEGNGLSGASTLFGTGYPYPQPMLSGKECAQFYLRTGLNVFGSQTNVMYRSAVVRHDRPFYDKSLPNTADFEKCMQILQRWDFGFVHQLLSFTRRGNKSLISARLSFRPFDMDRYVFVRRHAAALLESREATSVRRKAKRVYYRLLAREALRLRERAFWRHHQVGLKAVPETVDWPYLALQIVVVLIWIGLNPGRTVLDALRSLKLKMADGRARAKPDVPASAQSPEPNDKSPKAMTTAVNSLAERSRNVSLRDRRT